MSGGLPPIDGEVAPVSKVTSILLGHVFLENNLDLSFSCLRENVADCGYDYLILGHDHEPWPIETINNTQVLRVGSLGRNTSHAYQTCRQPQYIRILINHSGITDLQIVDVQAMLPSEVFREEVFISPSHNAKAFLSTMADTLSKFIGLSGIGRITLSEALSTVGAPAYVVRYLKSVCDRAHQEYQ